MPFRPIILLVCMLRAVVVEPESAHLFLWIAIPAKNIEAGVAIRIKIVFPEWICEPVTRETIAL